MSSHDGDKPSADRRENEEGEHGVHSSILTGSEEAVRGEEEQTGQEAGANADQPAPDDIGEEHHAECGKRRRQAKIEFAEVLL